MARSVSFTTAERELVVAVAAKLIEERVPFRVVPHAPSYVEQAGQVRELAGAGAWDVQVDGSDAQDLRRVMRLVRGR